MGRRKRYKYRKARSSIPKIYERGFYVTFGVLSCLLLGLGNIGQGGRIGDMISDALYKFIGVGAYLVPIFCLLAIILWVWKKVRHYHQRQNKVLNFMLRLVENDVRMVCVGILLADVLCFSELTCESGGYVGRAIVSVLKLFGTIGTWLILLAIAFFAFVVLLYEFGTFTVKEESPVIDAEVEEISEPSEADQRIKHFLENRNKPVIKEEKEENTLPRQPKVVNGYHLPSLDLLTKGNRNQTVSQETLLTTSQKIVKTLNTFGIEAKVINVSQGPTVTRYELKPAEGVKVSKILNVEDDLKLALAAESIRIEAPIPGKDAVGIEVPNKEKSAVMMRDLLETAEYQNSKAVLSFAVGEDITGKPVIADIESMPHLLIAGATGSGKSVCLNTLIISLLYKYSPEQVKLVMIDPKMVELKIYDGIPHMLMPVVTDVKEAAKVLTAMVTEMENRYQKFSEQVGIRSIDGYNKKNPDDPMSRIVVIIDELADMMVVSKNKVENSIVRLSQLARAAGIHLVIATQRPSVNVVTGLIKANMPSRIALAMSSSVDSRTIIDMGGAEHLLGRGDMLFYPQDYSTPKRLQGAYLPDEDIAKVVEFLTKKSEEETVNKEDVDALFEQAGRLIIEKQRASVGMLQKELQIGFNRAQKIMEQLHEKGVVSEGNGKRVRKILMNTQEFESILDNLIK